MEGSLLEGQHGDILVAIPGALGENPQLDLLLLESATDGVEPLGRQSGIGPVHEDSAAESCGDAWGAGYQLQPWK